MNLVLNFHGVGKARRTYEPNEEPYWLTEDRFSKVIDLIAQAERQIEITFDDGNSSDVQVAVPMLEARGLRAKFFVLAGRLGEPGYLTQEDVKQLDGNPLFAIGSHGMQHRDWTKCNDAELDHEIKNSKQVLEGLCQRMIEEVALPFGKYDRRVLSRLRTLGHSKIYSSDGAGLTTKSNLQPRVSLRSDMPLNDVASLVRRGPSIASRAHTHLRMLAKRGLPVGSRLLVLSQS